MKKGAFTLIEVMVSLAIFAMIAIVLGAAYANILNGYAVMGKAGRDAEDISFARQELLTQTDLQTAENGDEFDTADGNHVVWTSEITQATMADLFTVDFTCEITGPQNYDHKVTETFMLLRPTWSDPTDQSNLRQADLTRIAAFQGRQP